MDFEFQEKCINEIIKKFEKESIVYLKGPRESGKTYIAQNFKLSLLETAYIRDDIVLSLTEFGAIRESRLFKKRKIFKKILSVSEVITAIYTPVKVMINKVENLVDLDSEKIFKNFLNLPATLIVLDEFDKLDSQSKKIFSKIIKNIDEFPNIKLLIIGESSIGFSSTSNIVIPELTSDDIIKIGFSDVTELKNIPIGILLELAKNKTSQNLKGMNYINYLNHDFAEKISELGPDLRLILNLVYLYSEYNENEWVSLSSIISYTHEQNLSNGRGLIQNLIDKSLLQVYPSQNFVRFNPIYSTTNKQCLLSINLEDEIGIHLDYIERNAPFLYFEKFKAYQLISNNEYIYKTAIQTFFQYALEQGIEYVPSEVKKYLYTHNSEIDIVIFESINFYVKNEYSNAFHRIDIFLEKLQGHFFSYSIEIIAELVYLRALSLSRAITATKGTRTVEQNDINVVRSLSAQIKSINDELYFRLKRVEIILLNDNNNYGSSDNGKMVFLRMFRLFNLILKGYEVCLAKTLVKFKPYWQERIAILLSIVGILDIDISEAIFILERSYRIIYQSKEILPKVFLRVATNYAGMNFRVGKFSKSSEIICEAVHVINKSKLDVSDWGVILLQKNIFDLFADLQDYNKFTEFNNQIWNDTVALSKLHEKNLCIINYSLLLSYYSEDVENAIAYIIEALDKNLSDDYDKYFFYTNLGALYYLSNEKRKALEAEKKCLPLIDKGIIFLSGKDLLKRHKILIKLYSNNYDSHPKKIIDKISQNSTSFYYRLGLFSDISYWSN